MRYLRKERPTSNDLADSSPLAVSRLDFENNRKRYAAATGEICGTVVAARNTGFSLGAVSFISVAGASPVEHPIAEVKQGGSFCSGRLGPGKYYLYFTAASDPGVGLPVYHPGVSERAKALAVEVIAGQTVSGNYHFTVPELRTYSVRGLIFIDDKSKLPANNVSVFLAPLNGRSPFPSCTANQSTFKGTFRCRKSNISISKTCSQANTSPAFLFLAVVGLRRR